MKVPCYSPGADNPGYTEVYENTSRNAHDITIMASDHCPGGDGVVPSSLDIYTNGITEKGIYEIPDGGTRTKTFTLDPGDVVLFHCAGDGSGFCTYSLQVH